jgi:monofunctional biosynthetic peptidoglycan transglycosylase
MAIKVVALVLATMTAGLLLLLVVLRWIPLPTSAFMLLHKLNGNPVHYDWVPMGKISPQLAIAAVASEDQRFTKHWGIDLKAISEAIEDNRQRSQPRGASTISQQVAKNLFLWSGKSMMRKGLEAALTVAIELCWSKRRILEVYLNIAQFGPNIFGADAASRKIFGIPPSQLTGYQSALLVSVLPNPKHYRALPPTPYISQRAANIQRQVRLLGGRAYLSELME